MTQDAIDRAARRLMNLRPSENTVNPYKLVSAAVNALIEGHLDRGARVPPHGRPDPSACVGGSDPRHLRAGEHPGPPGARGR